jgi:hypothetical protein
MSLKPCNRLPEKDVSEFDFEEILQSGEQKSPQEFDG